MWPLLLLQSLEPLALCCISLARARSLTGRARELWRPIRSSFCPQTLSHSLPHDEQGIDLVHGMHWYACEDSTFSFMGASIRASVGRQRGQWGRQKASTGRQGGGKGASVWRQWA
ncbi:hypothetical protein B0H13DRAFT_2014864 [Mycena leptocephala]|nr:hypothetical protein B0H13DRAFT_2014864 [Mycena leptocephala]